MTRQTSLEVCDWVVNRELAREYHDNPHAAHAASNCDPIIETYRFCNVRREDDKVTRWLKKNWRDPYYNHPNFVAAMLLARMINWPPTLEAIGFPDKWSVEKIVGTMHAMTGKVWTSAYVITTCGQRMDKALYVVGTVCQQGLLPTYQPTPTDSLDSFWTRLRGIPGLGAGFIAAQVVADIKYTPLLAGAKDWWTWAVPGPGSRRGINRYFGYELNCKLQDSQWRKALHTIIAEVAPLLPPEIGRIHAQDWQNIMCEYDKWKRVKNGEGRPRQRYTPSSAYTV